MSQSTVIGTETFATTNIPLSSAGVVLPIIPLRDLVLFPQMVRPLFVGRTKAMGAVECAMATDSRVLVATQKHAAEDDRALNALHPVGVTANVINSQTLPDGTLKLFVAGLQRSAINRSVDQEYLCAEVVPVRISEPARCDVTAEPRRKRDSIARKIRPIGVL